MINPVDGNYIKIKLTIDGFFTNLPKIGVCQCKGKMRRDCGVFICDFCERNMPYCYGAADEYFDYCDDCVAAIEAINTPKPL